MASISSMRETEKFKRFEKHLMDGNFEGVRQTFEPEFMEEIIDDEFRMRPIHFACGNGHLAIVNFLIEKKCNIESETKASMRPIHFASGNGHLGIVKLLIENKCNIKEKLWEFTPFHSACERGHLEIVQLLIENKCNMKCENLLGERPIHLACKNGHLEIMKLLIENKCSIELENNWRMTPIHVACEKGHLEIVKLLIENKCNIERETIEEKRPIHFACQNGHKEIVKLLILQNCFINVSDKDRKTPLDFAKLEGHWEIIKIISEEVTKQINDSIIKKDEGSFAKFYNSDLLTGRQWLELAWENNSDKIIKYFLNRPIDVAEISYLRLDTKYVVKQSAIANLWDEVLLYKCIKQRHEDGFKLLCKPYIINCPQKIIPCSFLELAAQNGNCVLVEEILRKSIFDSETWEKAKNVALENGHHQIHNSISKREYLL